MRTAAYAIAPGLTAHGPATRGRRAASDGFDIDLVQVHGDPLPEQWHLDDEATLAAVAHDGPAEPLERSPQDFDGRARRQAWLGREDVFRRESTSERQDLRVRHDSRVRGTAEHADHATCPADDSAHVRVAAEEQVPGERGNGDTPDAIAPAMPDVEERKEVIHAAACEPLGDGPLVATACDRDLPSSGL